MMMTTSATPSPALLAAAFPTGPIRPATARDLPRLVAAADAIFRTPTRPGLGSMGHDYPLLFSAANASNLMLLEDDRGELLAHAGFVLRDTHLGGTTVPVATIGAVFTRPEQRGRGLASLVLAAAVERARRAGAELGLVSGQRGLYERAGFFPYPPCPRYRVAAAVDASAGRERVRRYTPAALPALMAIAAREPVHFVRSRSDWESLLDAGVLFFERAETFVIERGEEIVAYLAVGRPGLRSSESPGDARGARALELGGDREAIAAAAPFVARALGTEALDLIFAPGDRSMAGLAQQHGFSADEVRMPFTAAWWNPQRTHLPLPFYGFNYV
jgi:GNAT superfamily N-acetyltransferase